MDLTRTPALLLDTGKLLRNLDQMWSKAQGFGIDLRPHVKTTKSAAIARRAVRHHSGAITVSTLGEASYFYEAGFRDILYAVGIVPDKLDAVAALMRAGAKMTIVLDNLAAAEAVAARGRDLGLELNVLIELDCDGHRSVRYRRHPRCSRSRTILMGRTACALAA